MWLPETRLIVSINQISATSIDATQTTAPWLDGELSLSFFPTRQAVLQEAHSARKVGWGGVQWASSKQDQRARRPALPTRMFSPSLVSFCFYYNFQSCDKFSFFFLWPFTTQGGRADCQDEFWWLFLLIKGWEEEKKNRGLCLCALFGLLGWSKKE